MKYQIGSEWFKKLLEKGILECTPEDLYKITGSNIQSNSNLAELIDPDSFDICNISFRDYVETNKLDMDCEFHGKAKFKEPINNKHKFIISFNLNTEHGDYSEPRYYIEKEYDELSDRDYMNKRLNDEDLEEKAKRFLQAYYRDALNEACIVNGEDIAKKMIFNLSKHKLSEDHSKFGIIVFGKETFELSFKERLVLHDFDMAYDPEAQSPYDAKGLSNSTIIQECIIADVFREFCKCASLVDKDYNALSFFWDERKENNKDFMNIKQYALSLTEKIMMPLKSFKKEFELYYSENSQAENVYERIEEAVDHCAEVFGVSKYAVLNRLNGLKKTDLSLNGIKEIKFNDRELLEFERCRARDQFYISESILKKARQEDKELNNLLKRKVYQYIDGYIVYNHPNYIYNDNGKPALTEAAKKYKEECCLIIDCGIPIAKIEMYQPGTMHYIPLGWSKLYSEKRRYKNRDIGMIVNGKENKLPDKYLKEFEEQAITMKKGDKIQEFFYNLPRKTNDALSEFMRWRNTQIAEYNDEQSKALPYYSHLVLAGMTGLDESTVNNAFSSAKSSSISHKTLTFLCLALHMPYCISSMIFRDSHLPLSSTDPDHIFIDYCLRNDCYSDFANVQEKLIKRFPGKDKSI